MRYRRQSVAAPDWDQPGENIPACFVVLDRAELVNPFRAGSATNGRLRSHACSRG